MILLKNPFLIRKNTGYLTGYAMVTYKEELFFLSQWGGIKDNFHDFTLVDFICIPYILPVG